MLFTGEGALRQSETKCQLPAEGPKTDGVPPIAGQTISPSGGFRLVIPARFETAAPPVAGNGIGISAPVRMPVPRSSTVNI